MTTAKPVQPLFSIVIPTYNRADRILPTLQSVKQQTLTAFECIVVDDGSRDGDQLKSVVANLNDDRFKYIRQPNGGACSARNRGFDIARGTYVALLDSDDLFVPSKLEQVWKVVKGHDEDILVYSRMIVERGLAKKWIRPSRGPLPTERLDEYLLCTSGTVRTSTVVVNTTLARRIRFDESLPSLQDTDFAIRVASAGVAIIFVSEPLTIFQDAVGYSRVSRNVNYRPLLLWLERMRHVEISERAYWAGRGWQCARIASYTNRPYALKLYIQAALRGAFPPRHAAVVAAQVAIPYGMYQWLANRVVTVLGKS